MVYKDMGPNGTKPVFGVSDKARFKPVSSVLFDLAPSSIDKLLGFLWALIVLPWLQIYSCFVMKGTL